MNPERAIEQFKYHTLCDSTGFSDQYDLEACIEAVSALKKMIPMKPSCISVDWFQCPSCRNRFGYNIRSVVTLYKYCPSCGQAIDWR